MGLPCWLLGLTLGPIIPAGLAQVPESLVSVYLGLGLDAVLVPVPKASGCISGTIKNKSTQEKRPCSSCSETGEMKGMCEHLAKALDLDRGLRKGVTLTGLQGREAGGSLSLLCSPPSNPQAAMWRPTSSLLAASFCASWSLVPLGELYCSHSLALNQQDVPILSLWPPGRSCPLLELARQKSLR